MGRVRRWEGVFLRAQSGLAAAYPKGFPKPRLVSCSLPPFFSHTWRSRRVGLVGHYKGYFLPPGLLRPRAMPRTLLSYVVSLSGPPLVSPWVAPSVARFSGTAGHPSGCLLLRSCLRLPAISGVGHTAVPSFGHGCGYTVSRAVGRPGLSALYAQT